MPNSTLRIYTVVDVMAGVVAGAKSFVSLKEARAALRRTRRARNLDADDVQLIVGEITLSPSTIKISERKQERKA